MLNYSILGLIFFTALSIVGSLATMIDEQVIEPGCYLISS